MFKNCCQYLLLLPLCVNGNIFISFISISNLLTLHTSLCPSLPLIRALQACHTCKHATATGLFNIIFICSDNLQEGSSISSANIYMAMRDSDRHQLDNGGGDQLINNNGGHSSADALQRSTTTTSDYLEMATVKLTKIMFHKNS